MKNKKGFYKIIVLIWALKLIYLNKTNKIY